MEINRLQSEKKKTKNPIIFVLIPIFNSMVVNPLIKSLDKGNHSDWAAVLTWMLAVISLGSLFIYTWKMIQAGKVNKKYAITLWVVSLLLMVTVAVVMYQISKPF
ncbi:MAG: hypothetical protein WCY89_00315 [Flavobacteriaceae bacterium]